MVVNEVPIFSKQEAEQDFQTVADHTDTLGRAYILGEGDSLYVVLPFEALEHMVDIMGEIVREIEEISRLVS